ncbi:MAG: ABC transporter permease, partial [Anaerolineaceae bacterium]
MANSDSAGARASIAARGVPRLGYTHWAARYLRQPMAVLGLALLGMLVLLALFAPQLASSSPKTGSADALIGPSGAYWFGTDDLGRDTFSNVVYGARAALLVGLVTAGTSLVIGGTVGIVSGYFGGYIDDALMRLTETFQLIPRFFLALLVITVFGSELWLVSVLLGVTFWPGTARVLRAQVLTLRTREF